ncbi:hypothetical protein PC119_g16539 [Phytophthora cactorum]|nr:hypothetical protein PC119_g16539 [Phytophthora cactorum]
MTPRYAWKTVCSDMAREDSQLLMEDMKVFIIVKSHLVPCSVCDLTRPHKMRYQLLRCSSETCKAATPYDACQWLGNKLACQELNRVTIAESGIHKTLVREPRQSQLTPRLKDYGREMATQGLKPARIRVGMARRFGLSEAEMPTLRQVQWFISHYSKKTLHRNDDHDEILVQIDQLAYGPQVSDTSPFSFGWERDVRGKPDVDNGSDENPFLVGLTTKRLLLNAARDSGTFVFHMDATFKLNQVAYPVIVCGVSDRYRSFHLVALFITSQRLNGLYVKALSSLLKVFTAVTGQQLLVKTFKDQPDASQQLKSRVKDFRRRDLLQDMTPKRTSIEFLLVSPNPDVVRMLSRGCHRVYLPELGRSREVAPVSAQMGSNYARMETEGQPEGGWSVDVTAMSCGCKYHFKFAMSYLLSK